MNLRLHMYMPFRSLVVVAVSLCGLGAAVHPSLPEVKTVYLLPMGNALDQYLANRLTKAGRFEVVTDPEKADAVFTDRLGMAFEQRWNELYPPPHEAKPAESKPEPEKHAKGDRPTDLFDNNASPAVRIGAFARGRGNIFLVSRKDRTVIWSDYATPKNMRSQSLNDTAQKIVQRLENDLNPKK